MSSVPFGGKKANRFFSRRLAELNEARTKSALVKDLDPEIEATYGKEIAERHEVSENIKLHSKDAEDLRESLKAIYKSAQPIGQLLVPWADAMRAHTKTIQAFVDHLEPGGATDGLRTVMVDTVRLHETLVTGLDDLTKALEAHVVQPQQAFIKRDIRDARYFSHEFLKAQVDYENAVSRLNKVKQQSKVDVKKYNQAVAEMTQFRTKFDQVAFDAQSKFSHMVEANAVDNAAHQLKYVLALRQFFERGLRETDEMMAHLETIDKDVAARRGERPTDFSAPAIPAHFESNTSLAAVAETPTKVLSTEEKYDTLVQLLTRPDLKVLNSLNTLVPDEEKAELRNSVMRIFEQTKSLVPFLAGVLEAETARADAEAPLTPSADGAPIWAVRPIFDSDPIVTEIVEEYLKTHGKHYAKVVLGPTIRLLEKESGAFELHPKKVAGPDLTNNANRLKKHLRDLVDAIISSPIVAPQSIRQLCEGIRSASARIQDKAAVKRDPKADVAALLFFHLFVPALQRPDEYDIPAPTPISAAMKRNLYLLSLALRGVARRAKADEKSGEEWFMGPVDDAVLQYAEYVAPYIATMCGENESVETVDNAQSDEEKYPPALRQQDLDPLIARLDKNLLQLTPALAQNDAADLVVTIGDLVRGVQTLSLRPASQAPASPTRGASSGGAAPDSFQDDDD